MITSRRIAVIGLGNPDRADDAAGILVLRALAGRLPEDVTLMEGGDPISILGEWDNFDVVILVDAVRSGAPVGTIHVFDGRKLPPAVRPGVYSTHGFGMRDLIGVGEALRTLPAMVRVVGIEGSEFTPGARPTQEVERAVGEAVNVVLAEIASIGHA